MTRVFVKEVSQLDPKGRAEYVRSLMSESDPKVPAASSEDGQTLASRRAKQERQREEESGGKRGLWVVIGIVAVGGGLMALALGGMKDNAIYSKPVDQLVADKAKFAGKPVRAEGNLVHGTLMKQEKPCEYRFTIEKNGVQVPVRYPQCVVPDTFRDIPTMDVGVTVEGELRADNTFEATSVLAKCPSKYEMEQRSKLGEKMPHDKTM